MQIVATTDAPITTGINAPAYSVLVTANGQDYESGAFVIKVEKGTGIFGF